MTHYAVPISNINSTNGMNPTNCSRESGGGGLALSRDSRTTESRPPKLPKQPPAVSLISTQRGEIMTAVRQVVAGLSGIALAGGIALGASVALASSAHATCAGTFSKGVCTVVTPGAVHTDPTEGPSGRENSKPWTQTVTDPTTVTTYHGNGPGSKIGEERTGGGTTYANPGGHVVDGVPGGGAP